jgi:SnoaL-like domain
MDADRHAEIVQRVRAMYAGELAMSLAPDFAIHEPESLPYGGVHRGPDAGATLFESICAFWKDASFELVDVTASDDHAIALITLTITSPHNHEQLTMTVCEVLELDGDSIRRVTVCHFDTAAMAVAAGLLAPLA